MVNWSHNIDYKPTIYFGLPQLGFFFTILFSYIVILSHGPWQFTSLTATHYILFLKTRLGVVSNFASPPACPRRCTAAAWAFSLDSTPWLPLASFGVALERFFLHLKMGQIDYHCSSCLRFEDLSVTGFKARTRLPVSWVNYLNFS